MDRVMLIVQLGGLVAVLGTDVLEPFETPHGLKGRVQDTATRARSDMFETDAVPVLQPFQPPTRLSSSGYEYAPIRPDDDSPAPVAALSTSDEDEPLHTPDPPAPISAAAQPAELEASAEVAVAAVAASSPSESSPVGTAIPIDTPSTSPSTSPIPSDSSQPPPPSTEPNVAQDAQDVPSSGLTLCVPCIPRDVDALETQLLPSILAQEAPPAEVLVALSDVNESYAASLQQRWSSTVHSLRILPSPLKRSPGQNRNRCAFEATQPIVSFIDADDEMHPQRLAILQEVLRETNTTCALHSFTTTPISRNVKFSWRDKIHSLVYFDSSWECLRGKEMMRRAAEFINEAYHGKRSYPFEQHGHPTCYRWVLSQVHFDTAMEGEDTRFNSNVWHKYNQSVFVPLPLSRWEPSDSQPIMKASVSVWTKLENMLDSAGMHDAGASIDS